jgi:cyclic 2,3-diphosphoglycerate synthase
VRTAVVLVDGEHYPDVIRAALLDLATRGMRPVAAVFLGGTEKIGGYGEAIEVGTRSEWVERSDEGRVDPRRAAEVIRRVAEQESADTVVDLSDEPIIDARTRLRLAAYLLHAGLVYQGADFRFEPPPRPRLTARPTIAVIGTGKRTGKTAVAGELVRRLAAAGREAVVVAMGRGGPSEPIVVQRGQRLDAASLLAVVEAGGHAASDFYEDAVTTGAATVGARRCGGGLAGAVGHSNVADAIRLAGELPGDLTVLEGSGAAIPPAHADATVLVVPGDADPEQVAGYLGGYRVLLADLIILTMCEPPRSSPPQVEAVLGAIRSISRSTPRLRTVFRPVPLGPISGATVFFATTASAAVSQTLAASLEATHGCEVVGVSNRLADRPALRAELEAAPPFDVLLVELKAAAVDVAARHAGALGARVVFCDNRPVVVGAEEPPQTDARAEPGASFDAAVGRVAQLAERRFVGA